MNKQKIYLFILRIVYGVFLLGISEMAKQNIKIINLNYKYNREINVLLYLIIVALSLYIHLHNERKIISDKKKNL